MKLTKSQLWQWTKEANLPHCHTSHPKALERLMTLAYAAGAKNMQERCARVIESLPRDGDGAVQYDRCVITEAIRALDVPETNFGNMGDKK